MRRLPRPNPGDPPPRPRIGCSAISVQSGEAPMAELDGPFGDLAEFLAIPRVTGLALAPDGSRLVVGVQKLAADGKKFTSSVWQVDTDGGAPTRLTRSAGSESAPGFLPDGSLLFVSKRADPDAAKDDTAADGGGL